MKFDAIIIGGNFAGLSAAIQLGRARRKVAVIDAGKPRNRFTTHAHGFFGLDGMPPLELMEQARQKVLAYSTVKFISGEAISIEKKSDGFDVKLASNDTVEGSKLILATGISDILPDLPGLQERWGRTVVHCPYCHGYEFQQKPLGVLFVSPMSSHQALLVPDWGPTTYFLNGNDLPDADTLRKLKQRNVTVEAAKIVGFEGAAPELSGVRLTDGRTIPIAGLFVAPRVKLSPLIHQLGCALEEGPMGQHVKTDEMKMTSIPGVYAAGDIARMMQNATLASADGVMAGAAAHRSMIFDPLE